MHCLHLTFSWQPTKVNSKRVKVKVIVTHSRCIIKLKVYDRLQPYIGIIKLIKGHILEKVNKPLPVNKYFSVQPSPQGIQSYFHERVKTTQKTFRPIIKPVPNVLHSQCNHCKRCQCKISYQHKILTFQPRLIADTGHSNCCIKSLILASFQLLKIAKKILVILEILYCITNWQYKIRNPLP